MKSTWGTTWNTYTWFRECLTEVKNKKGRNEEYRGIDKNLLIGAVGRPRNGNKNIVVYNSTHYKQHKTYKRHGFTW